MGFLAGIKELLQKFERVATGPASAWVSPVGVPGKPMRLEGARWCRRLRLKFLCPLEVSTVSSSPQGTSKGAEGRQDIIRLVDAAKCEVYVCYEGPLGAHLKQEVQEKLWKGEYVEIFSLLPLEKFSLDRVEPDDSKKGDEEKKGGTG